MHRLKRFVANIATSQPFPVEVGLMFTLFILSVLFILPGSTSSLYGYLTIDDVSISALFLALTVTEIFALLVMDKGLRTTMAALEVAIFSFIAYSSSQVIHNGYGAAFMAPTIGALYVLVRLGDKNAI